MPHQQQLTKCPVRMYQTVDRIVMAVPLPGLEPEDIHVSVSGKRVTIHGEERGPHQHDRDLLLAEWSIGPYHCELTLPEPVDGALANATYGNGVFVLALPKLAQEQPTSHVEIHLQRVGNTIVGERVGHSGSTIAPTTTEEHMRKHRIEKS